MAHEDFMREALDEARKAYCAGEVPVGAVVVADGRVVGTGHNERERSHDPTAHAEIIAIRDAAKNLGRWRLAGATLYVTVEPCPMCFGAALQARLDEVVYGAADPKAGSCGSVVDLTGEGLFNHRLTVTGGVLEEECKAIIQEFFRGLRDTCGGMPEMAERARLENG